MQAAITRMEGLARRLKYRLLIAGGVVVLIGCRVALRFLPFAAVRRLLSVVTPANPAIPGIRSGSGRAVRAVRGASRYVNSTCLTQALAVCILMACERQPAQLRIGVRKCDTGRLEAHAWVESAGLVVLGQRADLSDYTLLVSEPAGLIPEAPAPPAVR